MIETITMPDVKTEYVNNTKISRMLPEIKDPCRKDLQISTMENKQIMISVKLKTDYIKLLDQQITYMDKIVMDAVYTIYISGSSIFTPEMVVRVMTGKADSDVTEKKKSIVISSLEKLCRIRISMGCTAEMIQRKLAKKGDKVVMEGYLLPLEKIIIRSGNHQKKMAAYHLIKKPVLYEYAEAIEQFIPLRIKVLAEVGKEMSDTVEMIQIKRFVLERIYQMRHFDKMISQKISYYWVKDNTKERGLLPLLGFSKSQMTDKKWRTVKARIHHSVTSILTDLQNMGVIVGFNTYQSGRSIGGVTIDLGS